MGTLTERSTKKAIRQAFTDESLSALIDRLSAIAPGEHTVLSCYLQLRPEDREQRRYWITLKDRIKTFESDGTLATLDRGARLSVERDVARLLEALEDPANLPSSRGLAIFACDALDLFVAVPLPRVRRTRIVVDDTPWMRELVAAAADFGRVIAVVVDRVHARLFEVTALDAAELSCIPATARRGGKFHGDRGDAPGWGERDYHQRIEHERYLHYAHIVEELARLTSRQPVRGIVIAGPLDHCAALSRFLPRRLAEQLLGTTRLAPKTVTPAQVRAAAIDITEAHERAATERLLASFKEALGTGWAVEGVRETLRALAHGQARLLFVRDDFAGEGYRCAQTGRLVLAKAECRGEGNALPVRDVVDEAIEEALRQHVDIVTLHEDSADKAVDTMAAMLRFR